MKVTNSITKNFSTRNKKLVHFTALLLFCLTFISCGNAQPPEQQPSYRQMTSDGAWCWFSDPRAVYYEGEHKRTYIGWTTSGGDIRVGSYDHGTGEKIIKTIHKNFQADDHTSPSLLVRDDGKIMVFYSYHGGGDMFVRVSKEPENINKWEETRQLGFDRVGRGVCYTNPVQLSLEDDRLYVFWRGIDWKPTFAFSQDLGESWSEPTHLIDSPAARPYLKVASNDKNEIHFAFTTGHPRQNPQNSIYYMMYRQGNFYKANGTKIKSTDGLPVRVSQADVVYDAAETDVRAWVWDIAVDKESKPVIVYTRLPDTEDHRYHYARWDGEKWNDHELCSGGKWFPQTREGQRQPEPHYSGGIVLDHTNPSVVYLSREINGTFEIEKWTTSDKGASWSNTPITRNSEYDNVRPVVPRNHKGKPCLFWMKNKKYIHYTDYKAALWMNIRAKKIFGKTEPQAVYNAMKKVADWQINHPSSHSTTRWTYGALCAGMAEWAEIAESDKYYNYLRGIGRKNNWQLGDRLYFADDHCIGQMYIELYREYNEPRMIEDVIKTFDEIIANPSESTLKYEDKIPGKDRWWWCDSLFMGPPVLAKLYNVTGDRKYLDFMNQEWWVTTNYLYDRNEHLYYRDSRYFDRREKNGEKVFWSRGNGWVFAGLAIVLEEMPKDYPDRDKYVKLFREMAEKLVQILPEDGLWHPSLLDPETYSSRESSGSGFFCYGLAWGINNGILDKNKYLPIVKEVWKNLVDCVHPSGKLGYVQKIGADPRNVSADETGIYGVGSFLLAGTEVYEIAKQENQ